MNLAWKYEMCGSNCIFIENYDGSVFSKESMIQKKPKKCPRGGKCKWKLVK